MSGVGRVERAAGWLAREGFGGDLAVVLGSGLSSFLDGVAELARAKHSDVPEFAPPGVAGHDGRIVSCRLGGKRAIVLSGRVHHYEGRSPDDVSLAVRVVSALGVPTLVLTNASGGIDPGYDAGDLMLIADQVSLLGGRGSLRGPTFRMAGAYSPGLRRHAREVARERGLRLREGVYAGSLGPTYETPSEIALARTLGASAVGMSTVTEAQAAAECGLALLGVSLITNVPLPGRFTATSHDEVLEAGRRGGTSLLSLVSGVAERL